MKRTGQKQCWWFLTTLGGILLLLSLLAACGGGTTSTPTKPTAVSTPTSTPTSQVTASPLVGYFVKTITKADIPKDSPVSPGYWMLRFTNDGLYDVRVGGAVITYGTYQVKQNQLTFINDFSCVEFGKSENIPDAGTGTYTWMLKGKMLTLKAVHDTCPDRKLVFPTHPWVKLD